MSFVLRAVDQDRLQNASRALLSPLDCADVREWCIGVNRSIKALLGADMASLVLPAGDASPFHSEDLPPDVLTAYPSELRPLNAKFSIWKRMIRLGAFNRELLWRSHARELYHSGYYNDLVVPARAYDTIGLALAPEAGSEALPHPHLMLHHDSPRGRRFGPRGLALLRLLLPAFEAGVRTLLRLGRQHASLVRSFDQLAGAVLLYDAAGRLLHRNPAADRMLTQDPDGPRVGRALERLVSDVAREAAEQAVRSGARTVRTRMAAYRLRATRAEALFGGSGGCMVGTVDRLEPTLPAASELRTRYRLSKQQTRVAVLLAERRSNREIAEALVISPHTAKRHTEQVYLKLGVTSRRTAAAKMRGER